MAVRCFPEPRGDPSSMAFCMSHLAFLLGWFHSWATPFLEDIPSSWYLYLSVLSISTFYLLFTTSSTTVSEVPCLNSRLFFKLWVVVSLTSQLLHCAYP